MKKILLVPRLLVAVAFFHQTLSASAMTSKSADIPRLGVGQHALRVAAASANERSVSLPAPTGLAATTTDSTRIRVTWNPVGGAIAYFVMRYDQSDMEAEPLIEITEDCFYDDYAAAADVDYLYVVCACRDAQQEDFEFAETVGRRPSTSAPSTGALPAPTGLSATTTDSTRIRVTWNPVGGAIAYFVMRYDQSDMEAEPLIEMTEDCFYDDYAAAADVDYLYVVCACRDAQQEDFEFAETVGRRPAAAAEPVFALVSLDANETSGSSPRIDVSTVTWKFDKGAIPLWVTSVVAHTGNDSTMWFKPGSGVSTLTFEGPVSFVVSTTANEGEERSWTWDIRDTSDNVACSLTVTQAGGAGEDDAHVTQDMSIPGIGWHEVSFPVLPEGGKPADVFAPVEDKIGYVTYGSRNWNPATGGTLVEFEIGKGYWVQTTADEVSWTVTGQANPGAEIVLKPGWNLIGYPLLEEGEVGTVLATALATGNIRYIYSGSRVYPGTLTTMTPGKGYWVYAEAAGLVRFDFNE